MSVANEQKRKVVLALCASRGMDFALGVTILSFLKHNAWFKKQCGDIWVYHNGIHRKSRKTLLELYPRTHFENYSFFSIRSLFSYSYWRFSSLIFARFDQLKLLDSYDIVLGSDIDVIFVNTIEDILQIREAAAFLTGGTTSDHFFDPIPNELNFLRGRKSLSMGMYVLKKEIGNTLASEEAYRIYEKFCFKLRLPEQGVFNILFHANQIDTANLGPQYASRVLLHDTRILHASGYRKLWDQENTYFHKWYRSWLGLGGRPKGNWFSLSSVTRRTVARFLHRAYRFSRRMRSVN